MLASSSIGWLYGLVAPYPNFSLVVVAPLVFIPVILIGTRFITTLNYRFTHPKLLPVMDLKSYNHHR